MTEEETEVMKARPSWAPGDVLPGELPMGQVGDFLKADSKSRPGWQTTEFWVTVLVVAGVFALLLTDKLSVAQVAELWPIFVSSGAYAYSRGVAKG